MPVLIAAVVAAGGLCLLNLLMTFGVIRRLREHTAILAGIRGSEDMFGLQAGQSPGAFSAVTIAGNTVSNATSLRMIAFLSSFCSVCPERVPPFVEYLSGHRIGPGQRADCGRRQHHRPPAVPGPARRGGPGLLRASRRRSRPCVRGEGLSRVRRPRHKRRPDHERARPGPACRTCHGVSRMGSGQTGRACALRSSCHGVRTAERSSVCL